MAETKFLDSAGLTHLLEKTNAKFSKLGHTHTKAEITDFAHTHDDRYYTETEINSKLNGKSNTGHTHDDRYYTESEINTKLAGKSDTSHSHTTHLTTDIATGADLNTITTAGWYKCPASVTAAGLKHCPTQIAFAMEVLLNAGVTQKLYEFDSSLPKVYIRNSYNSWGEWKRVYTTADKPTAGEIGAAASSHTHTKSQITDFPSSMKNPNSLTISLNGTSQGAYDGSASKSINVTPSSIGAATSGHTHNVNSLYGTVPISKGGTGATTAAEALANLGAMPEEKVQAHIANTTIHITAAERTKWNAKADITIGTAEPTSSTSGIFYIQTN